jgi:hypothetical protein
MSTEEVFNALMGLSRQEKFQAMELLLRDLAALELNSPPLWLARGEKGVKIRQAGSAEGLIYMAEDFDAPLADFDEYMS